MKIYVVTYDVKKEGRRYDTLHRTLRLWPFTQILESVWLVAFDGSAQLLRDELKPHMDLSDRLVIVEFTEDADWAINNLHPKATDWLIAHRP